MHLAFVDITYGYAADRPEADAPLGGTTSALCFLARELTRAGVACTFFNRIPQPAAAHGIASLPLDRLIDALGDPSLSAIICCGRWMEDMVRLVRHNTQVPLIAWMHESTFQTKLTPASDVFDGVVYVSEWQKRVNQIWAKPKWRQTVIRNAMNPAAVEQLAADASLLAAKQKPPVLLYAGNAARGVVHLPPILEQLRKRTADFTMEIFCNTDPSGNADANAQYITWLRGLPNVTHVGMVGQTELIRRMKRATLFVSPNPWPETSCIAMIEAMASGLSVITTNRAALPETASGFATHISVENADDPLRFDMPVPAEKFAEAIGGALELLDRQPNEVEQKLRAQIDYFHAHYVWQQRVEPWVEFVKRI